jgi:FKBP-type peptidyl-prolyl cis-trans isomerase FklB
LPLAGYNSPFRQQHIRFALPLLKESDMMRLLSAFAIASVLAGIAVAQEQLPPARKSAPAPMPQNQQERAGYALGLDIGKMLKARAIEVDLTFLTRGIRDALTDAKPLLSDQEIQETMQVVQKESQARVVAKAKAAGARNKIDGDKFLAANAKKQGVQTTKSGLQYKVLKDGQGPSPKPADVVRTHYHGTFINGDVFDSSVQRGEPAEFPVNGVIPGWTEALQLMKVGSKWQLFVPPALAYGEQGFGDIPPNTTLTFEVELLDIVKSPDRSK